MGTWGTTAFEDDTAMEFYDEFCFGDQNIADLITPIEKVLSTTYRMTGEELMSGFNEPVRALVAAEIFAAANGHPLDTMPGKEYHQPEEVDIDPIPMVDLEKVKAASTPAILDKIRNAVTTIRDTRDIHLTELWLESESYEEWKEYLSQLIKGLERSE